MKILFTLLITATTCFSSAQEVAQTIIVEHYTNTYCSACASRNPGFYSNLDNHTDVLHISYHPSAPYSACPLSQHNVSENDARTNFYGIYGGTPRIVVQGDVVAAGNNYSSSTIFDPYENQTTAFNMTTTISQNTTLDSVIASVTVTKTAASSIDSLDLYTVIVEETLNFNANNGENLHHNVFRKSMVGEQSIRIELPEITGEDTTLTFKVKINSEWNGNELKVISILQNDQKSVEQASESTVLNYTVNLNKETIAKVNIYPNPTNGLLSIIASKTINRIAIYTVTGQEIQNNYINNSESQLDLTKEKQGVYICKIYTSSEVMTRRLIKK